MNNLKQSFKIPFLAMLMLLTCVAASAQFQVKGKVVSANDSEPMTGVVIMEKGTQNGVSTDIDGNYTINVKSGNATLNVTYVGCLPQTIAVNGRNTINVTMQDDVQNLDEVVVVGYGVQKKSDLTGSIASVKGDDIKNLVTTDAAAALQGKAAGVQILNTSGAPGAGAAIRVRGYSSNSGNLGPLLIVDGLKVNNIQYLDPSMIESMEVLKDAASAAIYGAQAGNGVVLITTKSGGKSNQPKITYSFKAVNQRLGKMPEIFGAKDWIKYKEMQGQDMKKLCGSNGVDYDNPAETNWVNEVFAPSWSTQHSVTFQDGNKDGHFFSSINWVNNDGIVKGNKDTYERFTAQLNSDYKLYNWIKVGTNTSIEKYARRSVGEGAAYGSLFAPTLLLDPLTPVYFDSVDDFTTDMKTAYEKDPNLLIKGENGKYYATSKFQVDDNGNPLLQRDRSNGTNSGFNVRGVGFVDLMPIKGVVATSRLSYRIAQSNSHNYSVPYYITGQARATDYSISAGANNSFYYQWENFVNYNKTFFNKHDFGAMAGMSYTESVSDNVSASANGKDGAKILTGDAANFQYLNYVNTASTTTKSFSNAPGLSTSMSYFGRVTYAYDNRYSLQMNYRADAFDTSKLPANKRWGKFPSFAAGWTISNEKFVTENIDRSILSFAKLRASWGRNGNINVLNGYAYMSPINYNAAWYQYTEGAEQSFGSYPNGFPNENLRWETSEQVDLGLDLRFLNDRLTIGMDYYNKDTKDLIVSISPAPEIYANGKTFANAGALNNKGFELEASWRDYLPSGFTYSVSGNMSTLKNEVTYLYSGLERIEEGAGGADGTNNPVTTGFEKGYPIWYFRAFDYAGVDAETGAPLFRNAEGKVVGSSELLEKDRKYIGSAIPTLTYGLTINMAYKDFDFTIFGTGVAGNNVFNVLYRYDSPMRNSLRYYMDNAWTPENKGASMPDPKQVDADRSFWGSSAVMFSGAYFKIKQLQLGYTLPRAITQKAAIKGLRLYVSLDDFFTFTKYPGMDPEGLQANGQIQRSGFDIGSYPTMKKVTMGATLSF